MRDHVLLRPEGNHPVPVGPVFAIKLLTFINYIVSIHEHDFHIDRLPGNLGNLSIIYI